MVECIPPSHSPPPPHLTLPPHHPRRPQRGRGNHQTLQPGKGPPRTLLPPTSSLLPRRGMLPLLLQLPSPPQPSKLRFVRCSRGTSVSFMSCCHRVYSLPFMVHLEHVFSECSCRHEFNFLCMRFEHDGLLVSLVENMLYPGSTYKYRRGRYPICGLCKVPVKYPPHTYMYIVNYPCFLVASCKCRGTQDQVTCSAAGGDADEEVGNKTETF